MTRGCLGDNLKEVRDLANRGSVQQGRNQGVQLLPSLGRTPAVFHKEQGGRCGRSEGREATGG